ncbi:hypothetical protein pb186bvf_010173 [Paramecium bursaria]
MLDMTSYIFIFDSQQEQTQLIKKKIFYMSFLNVQWEIQCSKRSIMMFMSVKKLQLMIIFDNLYSHPIIQIGSNSQKNYMKTTYIKLERENYIEKPLFNNNLCYQIQNLIIPINTHCYQYLDQVRNQSEWM